MNLAVVKKPRRLNIAALLNILVGVVSLSIIILIAKDPDIASKLQLDSPRFWVSTAMAGTLIIASILVLLTRRNSHLAMLGIAVIFYGALIYQSAALLGMTSAPYTPDSKLWANIVRLSLELALTVWATLSSKTRLYFAARFNAP